jgi:hypothetical protein
MDPYSSLEMEVLVRCMQLSKIILFSPSTVHTTFAVMFSDNKTSKPNQGVLSRTELSWLPTPIRCPSNLSVVAQDQNIYAAKIDVI